MMKKLILIILISTFSLSAQALTASALGMGLNYSARARGTASLGWNPANLGLMRDFASELSFLSFSTLTTNNSLSWSDINTYFQDGKMLTDQEKNDFVNLIKDTGLRLDTETSINIFSFVYGRYGFSLSSVSSGMANLPQEFFDLMFLPNDLSSGQIYDFNDLDAEGFSAIKASFGYAHWIKPFRRQPPVSIGGQLNYYFGLAVVTTDQAGGVFWQDSTGIIPNGSYYALQGKTSGPGGSGFSIDLSAATTIMDKKMDLSLSVKNLFGFINWSGSTEEFIKVGQLDSITLAQLADGDFPQQDTTQIIGDFSTPLPVTINLGAAYRMNESLTLTAEWKQGLDERFGNTFIPQIGVGAEYYITDIFPVRGGLTFGGRIGSLYSLGTGLNFSGFALDGAIAFTRGLMMGSNGFVGSLSFRVKM